MRWTMRRGAGAPARPSEAPAGNIFHHARSSRSCAYPIPCSARPEGRGLAARAGGKDRDDRRRATGA